MKLPKPKTILPIGILLLLFPHFLHGQGSLVKTGLYTGNQRWEADTVRITGDVTITGSLTIAAGTYVEFQGHFEINADSLLARGNQGDSITFAIRDTTGFSNTAMGDGGWKSINVTAYMEFDFCRIRYGKFINSDSQNPRFEGILQIKSGWPVPLVINNSVFSNNYSVSNLVSTFDNSGSEIHITGSSFMNNQFYSFRWWSNGVTYFTQCSFHGNTGNMEDIIAIHTIFEYNKSLAIGAGEGRIDLLDCTFQHNDNTGIWAGDHSLCRLINTRITGNNGFSLVVSLNSVLEIKGNVICGNSFSQGMMVDESTCAIFNNTICNNTLPADGALIFFEGTDPIRFYNNILYGNHIASGKQIIFNDHNGNLTPLVGEFVRNLIEGGMDAIGHEGIEARVDYNVNVNPGFADTADLDFRISASSPCINAGTGDTAGLQLPALDINRNLRIYPGQLKRIDIGAFEYQGVPANRLPLVEIIADRHIFSLPGNRLPVRMKFFDPDAGDFCSLVGVFSDKPEIRTNVLSSNADSVYFEIIVDDYWQGTGDIQVKVNDNHGNIGMEEFRVIAEKNICGRIEENTVWAADTVRVSCNIIVNSGITLTIQPGTRIEFAGNSGLIVNGSIIATGNENNRITFTSGDTTGYYNSTDTGWNNISLVGAGKAEFKFCDFLYAKKSAIRLGNTNYLTRITHCNFDHNATEDFGGGVFLTSPIVDFSHNVFSNNRAVRLGGGVYLNNVSDKPFDISNNLFVNNRGDQQAAFGASGSFRLINNTFADNEVISNGGGIVSLENGSILNSIIWANHTGASGIQVILSGSNTVRNCIIEKGVTGIRYQFSFPNYFNDIDAADPDFVNLQASDFHLQDSSIAINAGMADTTGLFLSLTDIEGNPRIVNGRIDIGAYEYQKLTIPTEIQNAVKSLELKIYPNPTTGVIYLSADADVNQEVNIRMLDMQGRTVLQQKLDRVDSGTVYSIDLSSVDNGVYMLMINQHPVRIIKDGTP
jgi:hypothetical protein